MLVFLEVTLKNGSIENICYDCTNIEKLDIEKDIPEFLSDDKIEYESYKVKQQLEHI